MALSLRGTGENSALDGGDVTVNLPGGTAENDVVYFVLGNSSNSDQDMAMITSGYTELADIFNANTLGCNLGVFRKVQGATPDSTAVGDGVGSSLDCMTAVLHVWTGADTTTPEDATTTFDNTTDAGNPNSPEITTVTDGAIVLSIGSTNANDASVTAPTNYINQVDIGATDNRSNTVGMASREIASAGPENPGAWSTWSAAGLPANCAVTVAIRPAGGGGAFSLALDSVAWSWSATAVALERGREVVPANVSWAWTAQDATLTKGKELALDSVAWSWTITDAALEHGWEIVPAAVSWSYTVTDVSLERGFEIVPDSVAWAWAAQDVDFIQAAQKFIVPDSVAWSWAADDVALEYGRLLTAESVAWQWNASDVTFSIAGVVTPAAGGDSGAGAGHRKKWKIIPLDEWLRLHHPEESVEEQKEVIEELAEAIEEAPPLEAANVAKQIALETKRVENLVSELKGQSARVQGLTELLHELALYKDALLEAKAAAEKRMKAAHRLLREMDDEEIILTILYHA